MSNSTKPRLLTVVPDARPARAEGDVGQLRLSDETLARMEKLGRDVPLQQLMPVGSMYQTVLWEELLGMEGVLRARQRLECNISEQLDELEVEVRKQRLIAGV